MGSVVTVFDRRARKKRKNRTTGAERSRYRLKRAENRVGTTHRRLEKGKKCVVIIIACYRRRTRTAAIFFVIIIILFSEFFRGFGRCFDVNEKNKHSHPQSSSRINPLNVRERDQTRYLEGACINIRV